ncbi:hypothetical protein C7S20_10915 [Christiangramia fulva]|uniref:Uncharacterized protein n=1 Tax=Christiangramia fulva TaxID=2126553 RepID=A0A2R3Z620_9FLAO|nr:hypothetical protein [Christiangramia fulva]AVR45723.1 hypothetical protein C7S20_10915 [Christiangramia fulva]
MEKQFNREEELIKKLLNEAGTEKPSAAFKSNIMMNIEARKASVKEYKPLIPAVVWYVVVIAILLSVGALYFQFSELNIDLSGNFNLPKFEIPSMKLPDIEFSRTMQYGIAFVALFFLQIPFLKRFIDNQRM